MSLALFQKNQEEQQAVRAEIAKINEEIAELAPKLESDEVTKMVSSRTPTPTYETSYVPKVEMTRVSSTCVSCLFSG
jgi:hypothetical protein